MMQQGHVRFGVALVAALTLHALVFMIPSNHGEKLQMLKPLQITILPEPVSEKSVAKNEKQQAKIKQIETEDAPESEPSVAYEDNIQDSQKEEVQSSSEEQLLLPEDVQATILASVQYPRRARRNGWQGDTELQFYIKSEQVSHISVVVSSGFELLDAAAFQALASVSTLPLSDGNYRLPVMFRIE